MIRRLFTTMLCLACSAAAAAQLPSSDAWGEGIRWIDQPVKKVSPEEVTGTPPYVPGGAPDLSGPVELREGQAIAFWISALELVQVRGDADALEFQRVIGERTPGASFLRVRESGIPVRPGVTYLAEPIGEGSVWIVSARRHAQVRVERPTRIDAPLAAESLRAHVLAWIDGKEPLPPLPMNGEVRTRLRIERQLGDQLLEDAGADESLNRAVRAWRKASALQALQTIANPDPVAFRMQWSAPEGPQVDFEGFAAPYARVAGPEGRWVVDVDGPALLSVDARAVLSEGQQPPTTLAVETDGRVLRSVQAPLLPALMEAASALPGTRTPRLLPTGEQTGQSATVKLAVPPGSHRYTVHWRGGPLLVRALTAQHRAWSAEALRGHADVADWIHRSREALTALQSKAEASFLRARLDALEGSPNKSAPGAANSGALKAPALRAAFLLDLAERTNARETRRGLALDAADTLRSIDDSPKDADDLLWSLRLRTARLLVDAGELERARALLRTAPSFPSSGTLAAEAAGVIATFPEANALRSRALAALELAWRAEPLSESVKAKYREAWAGTSRWRSLSPDDRRDPPPATQWLDRVPHEPGRPAGAGALLPLEAGAAGVRVDGPADDGHALLLRAYVTQPPDESRLTSLFVDDVRVPIFPSSLVERVELALPRGEHRLRLEGPAGAKAWLSAQPGDVAREPSSEVAYVRRQWPIRSHGRSVRFLLPDAQLPTPVRVQLRAVGAAGKPIHLWARTDVGGAIRMTLEEGGASDEHLLLGLEAQRSSAAGDAVLFLPPFARTLWFETDDPDARVFAAVSIRRDQGDVPALTASDVAPDPAAPDLQELIALSREVRSEAPSTRALLRRAELLLDAAEPGLAREDLTQVLARQRTLDAAGSKKLAFLLDRLDREDAPLLALKAPLSAPVVLSPGLVVGAADVDPRTLAAITATTELPTDAGPALRYAKARALLKADRPDDAALELMRLYRATHAPGLAIEALDALARADTTRPQWREWGAPLGAALTEELADWADLPTVRHMRHLSAQWARWSLVRDAEAQAGTLPLAREQNAELDAKTIRTALLGAPWPLAETRLVAPGRANVFDLGVTNSASRMGAQVMCGSYRDERSAAGKPCAFTLRLDGRIAAEQRAALGEIVTLAAEVPPGRHQLELQHAETDAPVVAAVRFVSLGSPNEGEQADPVALVAPAPMPALRARPDLPITLTVLGPAALRIRARSFDAKEPTTLRVLDGGATSKTIPLATEVDPSVTEASAPVGVESGATVLITEPGPHTLRIETTGGEALVRVLLGRGERPADEDAVWWSQAPSSIEPLPWPALPPRLALLPDASGPASRPRDLGTLSLLVGYLGDDTADEDLEDGIRSRLDLRLGYRQELARNRAWLLVEPEVRLPLEAGPVVGGRAAFHARRLPLGLRLLVSGAMYRQSLLGEARTAARGHLSANRFVSLTPDLALIPGVGLTAERVDPGSAEDAQRFDHLVYSQYAEHHPLRWTPAVTLRWTPFIDEVGELSASAASNADLVTPDHASARIGWSTLLRVIPGARAGLSYEASWRFQDPDRAQAYLRHGLAASADLGVWAHDTGRLLLFAEDRAWLSSPLGFQNVVSVGLRWDWTGGRGLRDVLPYEEEFEQLLDPTQRAE